MTDPTVARSAETDLSLKSLRGGKDIDLSLDPDGDLYIDISEPRGNSFGIYLSAETTRQLRDWLNKVIP